MKVQSYDDEVFLGGAYSSLSRITLVILGGNGSRNFCPTYVSSCETPDQHLEAAQHNFI